MLAENKISWRERGGGLGLAKSLQEKRREGREKKTQDHQTQKQQWLEATSQQKGAHSPRLLGAEWNQQPNLQWLC